MEPVSPEHEPPYRVLIERGWEAVTLVDCEGCIRYASASSTRVWGYDLSEFCGHLAFEFVHPDDLERVAALFQSLVDQPGATAQTEYRVHHKDGSWRWTETTGTNLLDEPSVRAVVLHSHDITPRKELEALLQRQAAELAAADRRKDEFLAMLAHELRSPLAAIGGAVYLLEQLCGADPEARRLQNLVQRQTRQLGRLLEDLLDISRITHGKIALQRELVDFREILHHAVESSGMLTHRAGHRVSVSTAPEPLWIHGDPARLEQLVTNLLNNAAKYTPPGGEVTLWTGPEDGDLVFRVSDTGIGISPELLPRVFDLFTQAEQAVERSQGGLGLGLALVRRLVELHRGTVTAESLGPDQGSTFTVRIPLADEGPRAACRLVPPVSRGVRRVLVIEDAPDAAETLQDVLELAGHEVRLAHTGPEGVRQATLWQPDVVLCDIGLPGLDGYGVAEALRTHPATQEVGLIALTGFGQDTDRARAQAAGFDLHLTKPVDMDELQRIILQDLAAWRAPAPTLTAPEE